MKSYIAKSLLTLSFLVVGGLTAANAQVDTDAIFKVNVPFAFQVREKSFPAGEYVIKATDDNGDPDTAMEISGVANKKVTVFDSVPISVPTAPTQSNLVFGKVKGTYFLSEIWEDGNTNGNQVEEPANMKKLEKRGERKEKQVIQAERSKK